MMTMMMVISTCPWRGDLRRRGMWSCVLQVRATTTDHPAADHPRSARDGADSALYTEHEAVSDTPSSASNQRRRCRNLPPRWKNPASSTPRHATSSLPASVIARARDTQTHRPPTTIPLRAGHRRRPMSRGALQAAAGNCRQHSAQPSKAARSPLPPTRVKGKVFPYSLPSVGPGADPGVQAVSPQVT